MEETLSIGEVATAAGLKTSAIRYYESVGVLPEPERLSGQRRYDRSILERLGFIDVAQRAGFSLEEIQELLAASEEGIASQRLRELVGEKLPDVEALVVRAEAMEGWLEAAGTCECPTLDRCLLFAPSA